MNTRQRQTVILIAVMFFLAVGVIFVFADSRPQGDGGGFFEGQMLPEPFNGIINQSITGLRAAANDTSQGQKAIDENKNPDVPDAGN